MIQGRAPLISGDYEERKTGNYAVAGIVNVNKVHEINMGEHDKMSRSDKFKRAARELGCDEDEAAFDRALKQMKPPPEKVEKDRTHRKDTSD